MLTVGIEAVSERHHAKSTK